MSLSKKIRQFRRDNGISQEFMAEQLCMSQPTYCRLERHERKCTQRLPQIAKALSTTPHTLFDYPVNNDQNQQPPEPEPAHAVRTLLVKQTALGQHQSDKRNTFRHPTQNEYVI